MSNELPERWARVWSNALYHQPYKARLHLFPKGSCVSACGRALRDDISKFDPLIPNERLGWLQTHYRLCISCVQKAKRAIGGGQ